MSFKRYLRFQRFTMLTFQGTIYSLMVTLLLVGALVRQINLLIALYGMLVGPLLLSWTLSRGALKNIHIRRRLPKSTPAGDSFVVTLEVSNQRPRLASWALVVQDRIRRVGKSAILAEPSALFSYIPANESRSEAYRGQLVERGRYRFGPLALSTRFPFGLLKSYTTQSAEGELLVTPRLGRMTHTWHARLSEAFESGAHGTLGRQSREGDFFGLREWRPEDGRRAIHWRSSARRQTLLVRQFEQERRHELTLVLDLWQPAQSESRDLEHVELAVSLTATLLADLVKHEGTNVRCKFVGRERYDVNGPITPPLVTLIEERLAIFAADSHERLGEVLGEALDETRAASAVVLVTTRPPRLDDPQRFDEWWRTPHRQGWLSHLITLDVSQPDVNRYFEIE